jgi:hypothetical protein
MSDAALSAIDPIDAALAQSWRLIRRSAAVARSTGSLRQLSRESLATSRVLLARIAAAPSPSVRPLPEVHRAAEHSDEICGRQVEDGQDGDMRTLARLVLRRQGDGAAAWSAQRARDLLEQDDEVGAGLWVHALAEILRLQGRHGDNRRQQVPRRQAVPASDGSLQLAGSGDAPSRSGQPPAEPARPLSRHNGPDRFRMLDRARRRGGANHDGPMPVPKPVTRLILVGSTPLEAWITYRGLAADFVADRAGMDLPTAVELMLGVRFCTEAELATLAVVLGLTPDDLREEDPR